MPERITIDQSELSLMESALADHPDPRLFLSLARSYHKSGRAADAMRILRQGLSQHPSEIEARGLLAEILQEQGDTQGALTELRIAAADLGRFASVFEKMAALLLGEAEAQTERPIGFAKDSPDSKILADLYAKQGHVKEAAEVYERLIKKDPEDLELQEKLAGLSTHNDEESRTDNVIKKLECFKTAALKRARH